MYEIDVKVTDADLASLDAKHAGQLFPYELKVADKDFQAAELW